MRPCDMCRTILNYEFEQAPGVGDGQGGLAFCSPRGRKESDTSKQLNWYWSSISWPFLSEISYFYCYYDYYYCKQFKHIIKRENSLYLCPISIKVNVHLLLLHITRLFHSPFPSLILDLLEPTSYSVSSTNMLLCIPKSFKLLFKI